ncbi:acyl carrier protein [Corynebacterium anserum]|uniref:Acyl carrier protein n=1 Tax=Corynebacterium anserum TaxID=2684406 RepID=A0A7G7YMR8_9CORY|nr:acyl carrier protein [Corynebacterium anserum]MBC2681164.1 acyl carrier protein [Corynebacterium anserum]QNH95788.1 acyl carrier protein [Corynebacterium anserum]
MADNTTGISESAKQQLAAAMGSNSPVKKSQSVPESTESRVFAIVEDATGVDKEELTSKTTLDDDLNVDSLTLVDIAVRLEEEFNIDVEDEAINKVGTVGQLVKLVEKRLG